MKKLPNTKSFVWKKQRLLLLDQRHLPHKTIWLNCQTWKQVAGGIRDMVVRGAPAIGITAAYGLVLAAQSAQFLAPEKARKELEAAFQGLLAARPTAVNLRWALERMRKIWAPELSSPAAAGGGSIMDSPPVTGGNDVKKWTKALEAEAIQIESEDRLANQAMGRFGASLIPATATLMTHCNTGSLATAGLGTAFGVIWTAFHDGKVRKVLASETRPYLQGARLTAYELHKERIPFELITDNMAAHLMNTEKVDAVLVGADRIAANGDTANKIGTYSLAVLAAHHKVPFYVVAPLSTIDLSTPDGQAIPIEERSTDEVTMFRGAPLAPKGIKARHPAFDVTPASLITAIISERGIARPDFRRSLAALFNQKEPLTAAAPAAVS